MQIERDGDGALERVNFVGAGFGHGVGMCQTGAMEMARQGASHAAILQHYYAGTTLETLW